MITFLLFAILFVLVLSSPLARQTLGVIMLILLIAALYIGTREQADAEQRPECRSADPRGCVIKPGPYEQPLPGPYYGPQPYYDPLPKPITPPAPAKPRPYRQQ
jgi:hypothetical protein